jgi:flagellin-like hook-associated protein FlgL
MAAFTRNQVLSQAGTAMLSQAQSTAKNVLSLLG